MKVSNNITDIEKSCNYRNNNNCSLKGKLLDLNIIYKAQITTNHLNYKQKSYIWTVERDFINGFKSSEISFNIEHYENDTVLSKEYWITKYNYFIPKVTRRIIRKCTPFNRTKRKCYLCLNEKLELGSFRLDNLLNKRSEFIIKCRHQNKWKPLLLDCWCRAIWLRLQSCRKPTSVVGYVRDNSWISRNIRWLQNVSIYPLCLNKVSFVHVSFSRIWKEGAFHCRLI